MSQEPDINKIAEREAKDVDRGSNIAAGAYRDGHAACDRKRIPLLIRLSKYARHRSECGFWEKMPCTCGLYEARLELNTIVDGQQDHPEKITVAWLRTKHPELGRIEAESLRRFCEKKTIVFKGCYGNGEIMYKQWREAK